jgi:hypothetical protein
MNKIIRGGLCASFSAAALLVTSVGYCAAPAANQGVISVREFLNIGGTAISDLTNNAKFPNSPDVEGFAPRFEWPTQPPGDETPPTGNVKNNYGVQIIGYFYPTTAGLHTFYLSADDNAVLYLSTDSNPANKKLIAVETAWSPVRSYDSTAGGSDATAKNSSTYAASQWPGGGGAINLTVGQAYYIEALMKEGGGGDNLSVSLDSANPIPGTQLATINKTMGAVSITTHPQSQTILEGTPVKFSVVADGTPLFPSYGYQWKKGGVDITDETNWTYSIQFVSTADSGQYTVTVTGGQGAPVTSNPATLTVTADTTKPTLVSATGGSTSTSPLGGVTVVFSERMTSNSVATTGNYSISGGVTVSGVVVLDDTRVVLRTSAQTPNTTYTLTVNNVTDRATAPNTIVANSTVQFNSVNFIPSTAQWQIWNGGISILDLTNNLADGDFGRVPDRSFTTALFESGRGLGSDYGARGYGWFKAPSSGTYVFYITADDNARLYMSTDDNPANKKNIAAEATWSNNRDWTPALGTEQASDSYLDTEWPAGNTITLVQNQFYYMEAQWQEGGGGDGVEVTYKLTADADPVTNDASLLTGATFGIFADPGTLPPSITNRPTGLKVYSKGDTLTFTVGATGPVAGGPLKYQWYRSKVAVPAPAGTNNPLVIVNADHTSVGDYYVDVSNVNGSVSSFPDDDARAVMRGGFVIEAEDFNYTGGQHLEPVSSTMPYAGNAYENLVPTLDIDFSNGGDESAGAAFAYVGRFTTADANVLEMKGGLASETADPIQNALNSERGGFSVTANYALGWTDAGQWENYTRSFPTGTYAVVIGAAHDGRAANEINIILSTVNNPTIADGSVFPDIGGLQGVTRVGTFLNPATGAWSSNDLIPLREGDGTGPIATVALGGTKTVRLTYNATDGDADFLIFYPVSTTPLGPAITMTRSGGNLNVSWTPTGGTLESTPVLPATTWTTIPGSSPVTVPIGATGNLYIRVRQ